MPASSSLRRVWRPRGRQTGEPGRALRRRLAHRSRVHAADRTMQQPVDGAGQAVDERRAALPAQPEVPVVRRPEQDRSCDRCQRSPVDAAPVPGVAAEDGLPEALAHDLGCFGGRGLVPRGRLERHQQRLVVGAQVDDAVEPVAQVGQPAVVWPDLPQVVGEVVHGVCHAPRQLPEDVLLAGEVLVEGGARAAGGLGDELDAGVVEAVLAEHDEGGVEDLAPRGGPSLADQRTVPERRPPDHIWAIHGFRRYRRVPRGADSR
jgi:hypothetical protein